ncbi:hypothetical protein [Oculatella sp. FACHB-28]|nr:hypothetical protein [Oculatella sp. FACHB-28]
MIALVFTQNHQFSAFLAIALDHSRRSMSCSTAGIKDKDKE